MENEKEIIIKKSQKKCNYANTPTVFQMEMTECGAASLSMILKYYGVHISLEQLRNDTGVSRDGCKASKILVGARKYGFEAKGYRCNLKDILEIKPPCIIHWNFNHFVVYEGMKRGHVYINDPADGKRKLTMKEFDDGFTGVVLEIIPTKAVEKIKEGNSILSFLADRLKGQYQVIIYLLLMGFLLVFPGLLTPVFSQIFIDDILKDHNTAFIHTLVLAMITVAAFQAIYNFYRNLILARLKNKMSLVSAYGFIQHLFRLPMDFFTQRYAGDLGERVENNNNISEFLGGELAACVLNVIISLFYAILLIFYSPSLTILLLGIMLGYYLIIKQAAGLISKTVTKMQQDLGKLMGVVVSGVSIITTLKSSGIENEYIGRVLGYYTKAMGEKQKFQKMQLLFNGSSEIVQQLCNVLVLIIGGILVINGRMTVGTLIAFNLLFGYFMTPMNELVSFGQRLQKIKADIGRVEDILNYKEDIKYQNEYEILDIKSKLNGKIELKNIVFGYSKLEKPLIQDFNLSLNMGKSIAIVGSSGSGKSTISKLLSGLYVPFEGEICIDEQPLYKIPNPIIHSSIATVSQEISIFSGTIKENITMWNPAIKDEDIIRAAKDARIHEVITKKPGAYDYYLEEGGKNLSGGQKQRLEIARALVMNPTILIMDEATSALDTITEKEIVDNMKRRGLTCVIVAHRLSAIRDCDEIIVLDNGRIVQKGTHEELIEEKGLYNKLFSEKGDSKVEVA